MKRLIALILSLCLILSLSACGSQDAQQTETTAPVETTQPETTEAPTETEEATEAEPEADSPKAIAQSLIDHPVSELIDAIGEPESKDYAPSCLVVGGEDGNFYYDGFIVYTIKNGDSEKVYFVE